MTEKIYMFIMALEKKKGGGQEVFKYAKKVNQKQILDQTGRE